jgi:hypothetical protein
MDSMADFIPGYARVDLGPDGGSYDDMSNPKGCIHTTEGSTLAGAEAAYRNYPPHIGYDPVKRIKRQYVPLNRYSYAFKGSESDDEYIIQIEIVGFARQTHLWSDQIYRNIAEDVIKPVGDAIGIPRTALKFYGEGEGIILASPDSPIRLSAAQLRNYRGWLGHQHIPRPDSHWDPGRFLIGKCFAHLSTLEWRDDSVKNLILARSANGNDIWVGDGIHRRHVADMDELGGLQHWIQQKGGDPDVKEDWHDLRVLGIDITDKPVS